jgi:hypothetical protein
MFVLNTANLLPGDIVLTAQEAKVSRKIRVHTRSDYSHALLYVAHCSYIHSDLNGVHAGNTQRLLLDNPTHVLVLRVSNPDCRARLLSVCDFARAQIGKQYSVMEAAQSPAKRQSAKNATVNRQFCSRLVAQSYAYVGIPLVANPDYCYPGDLYNPHYVAPVENYLRIATAAEIKFAQSPSPINLQQKITNDITAIARRLSGEDIQTEEQIVDVILRRPEIDLPLTEYVASTGYLDLWKSDVQANPWRYDEVHFRALTIPSDEKRAVAHQEVIDAEAALDRFRRMFSIYSRLRQIHTRRYFEAYTQLYAELVRVHSKRLTVARRVLADA